MPEEKLEITFPTIKFPILNDLRANAFALASQYGLPAPETPGDITTIILTNAIVRLFCHDRIRHRPAADGDANLDVKGAAFLFIIGTAICRVLTEQENDVDLEETYRRSGSAIFQGCPDEYASSVLQDGQALSERLYDEAMVNGEINEYVLYVMSHGVLYAIEPREATMDALATLFEQIRDI